MGCSIPEIVSKPILAMALFCLCWSSGTATELDAKPSGNVVNKALIHCQIIAKPSSQDIESLKNTAAYLARNIEKPALCSPTEDSVHNKISLLKIITELRERKLHSESFRYAIFLIHNISRRLSETPIKSNLNSALKRIMYMAWMDVTENDLEDPSSTLNWIKSGSPELLSNYSYKDCAIHLLPSSPDRNQIKELCASNLLYILDKVLDYGLPSNATPSTLKHLYINILSNYIKDGDTSAARTIWASFVSAQNKIYNLEPASPDRAPEEEIEFDRLVGLVRALPRISEVMKSSMILEMASRREDVAEIGFASHLAAIEHEFFTDELDEDGRNAFSLIFIKLKGKNSWPFKNHSAADAISILQERQAEDSSSAALLFAECFPEIRSADHCLTVLNRLEELFNTNLPSAQNQGSLKLTDLKVERMRALTRNIFLSARARSHILNGNFKSGIDYLESAKAGLINLQSACGKNIGTGIITWCSTEDPSRIYLANNVLYVANAFISLGMSAPAENVLISGIDALYSAAPTEDRSEIIELKNKLASVQKSMLSGSNSRAKDDTAPQPTGTRGKHPETLELISDALGSIFSGNIEDLPFIVERIEKNPGMFDSTDNHIYMAFVGELHRYLSEIEEFSKIDPRFKNGELATSAYLLGGYIESLTATMLAVAETHIADGAAPLFMAEAYGSILDVANSSATSENDSSRSFAARRYIQYIYAALSNGAEVSREARISFLRFNIDRVRECVEYLALAGDIDAAALGADLIQEMQTLDYVGDSKDWRGPYTTAPAGSNELTEISKSILALEKIAYGGGTPSIRQAALRDLQGKRSSFREAQKQLLGSSSSSTPIASIDYINEPLTAGHVRIRATVGKSGVTWTMWDGKSSKAQFSSVEVGALTSDLAEILTQVRAGRSPDGPAKERLDQIFDGALDEFLRGKKVTTIELLVDGPLRAIPIGLVNTRSGPLGERYGIELLGVRNARRDSPIAAKGLYAFGITKSEQGLDALPAVSRELSAVTNFGRSTLGRAALVSAFVDSDFTKEEFFKALEAPRTMVHVASHYLRGDGSGHSGALAIGGGARLSAVEVWDHPGTLGGGLVILSGCETAADSRIDEPTAADGMGNVLLSKGAGHVLGTLWKVSDTATADFMATFYAHMSEGKDTTSALRLSQLAFRSSGKEGLPSKTTSTDKELTQRIAKYSAPYYWAAFVLIRSH